jgi:alkanesulfonate monooxygenase SsuD/methylene tetrahydromethanopterin reductase-like flavin-dependent oxidoreductase (luciferase family)
LKVGVQLPEIEWVAPWRELARMATTAERVGFDSLWVGDHLLYRYPDEPAKGPWEAWTLMGALAAITERIEIGPLVACTSFHNPAMIAKKAATLEEVSGGRLILGLGAGWNEPEYTAFGYPYDHRVSRFAEAFTIIRRLLRGEHVTFHGEYYDVDDCVIIPPGPRPAGPPLMIGSGGERMLEITMPHAQSWNAWYAWFGNRPEGLAPWMAKVDAACRKVGRDPAEVERTCAVYVQLPQGAGRATLAREDSQILPLTGSPRDMAEGLRAYADVGIGHVQIVLDPISAEGIAALGPVLEELDRG